MKQVISISIENGKTYDIQMDSGQRIKTTLRVLKENIRDLNSSLDDIEIREKRSGRKIDSEQTYEEAKIYTGFELIILPKIQI
jgi:hypothetical protein